MTTVSEPEEADMARATRREAIGAIGAAAVRLTGWGAGRVFYTALGHRPEVSDDPRFQRHVLEGIGWAMGADAGP